MKYAGKIFIAIIFAVFASCSLRENPVNPSGSSRNYYLGFTPFPYDVTTDAQEYVYNKIKTDADIICHRFDDGIPWNEALFDQDFNANITADWQYRKTKTPATHKVIVAITPINKSHDGLAPYKSDTNNQPLPSPWDFYTFNNPSVKTAYLNYCKRIVNFFNPDYLIIGIDVNLLINSDETMNLWNTYLELQQYVYGQLKNFYPNLPIMVSLSGIDLLNGYTTANNQLQMVGFSAIMNMTDYFALSLYPYLSIYLTDPLPSNMFSTLFSMSTKPICISETGYPAAAFTINGGSMAFNGTPQKQNNYFQNLFTAADNNNVRFIINFVLRDYDKLWQALGSPDDTTKIRRNTGFFDANGNARTVYETWKNKLNLVYSSQ